MSAPVRPYKNTQRALPMLPGSANKAPSESTNVPALKLPNIVPKDSAHSLSERPQLPEPTENPEGQTSAPKKPPPPLPRRAMVPMTPRTEPDQSNVYPEDVDSPSSVHRGMPLAETVRPKVERRLTVSPASKRPIFKSPPKLASKEQKNSSPPLSPTYSSNPETTSPLDEKDMEKYDQVFDTFAAELENEFADEFAGVLNFEIKTSEKPTENKSESDRPKKKSEKSSSHPTSSEDLEISGQNLSGARSPEKTSARKQKFLHMSRFTALPTEHRRTKPPPKIRPFKKTRTAPARGLKTKDGKSN